MKKKKKISKVKKLLNVLNEWKETLAIVISIAALIYFITEYKVSLENEIRDRITEDDARTLIQIENTDLKQDVRDIKTYLMSKTIDK